MTSAIISTETPFLDLAWRRQHGLKLMMAPIPVFPISHHQPLLLCSVHTSFETLPLPLRPVIEMDKTRRHKPQSVYRKGQ